VGEYGEEREPEGKGGVAPLPVFCPSLYGTAGAEIVPLSPYKAHTGWERGPVGDSLIGFRPLPCVG
jgi:hypothetical protein